MDFMIVPMVRDLIVLIGLLFSAIANYRYCVPKDEYRLVFSVWKFKVLVIGGATTLLAALFGFYVTAKEDSCLMVTYAVVMSVEFLVLVTGIVATVRLLFIIQTGLFDADVIPELTLYQTDPWVQHKWDTMQRKHISK